MEFGLVVRIFQQHAIGALLVKRHTHLGEMLGDQTQRKFAHHFKAGQARGQVPMRKAQQAHRVIKAGHRRPRR